MPDSEQSASALSRHRPGGGGRRHWFHGRIWLPVFVVLALIAAHMALFGLAFRGHLSLAVAAGVAAIVVLKFWWWRGRRHVVAQPSSPHEPDR